MINKELENSKGDGISKLEETQDILRSATSNPNP